MYKPSGVSYTTVAMPTLVKNKKVRFNYSVEEEFEAGIVLTGAEVKSCKASQVKLDGSYISYEDGELWVKHMHISPYRFAHNPDYDTERKRKLLMKKSEVDMIMGKRKQQGLTLIPESLYTTRGLIKVKVVLARGKKKHDKRADKKKSDVNRQIARAMRRKA